MSTSPKTADLKANVADVRLLETAEAATRNAFACAFSTADEYESALIDERRAAGLYASAMSPMARHWPTIALGTFAAALLATYLIIV